MRTPTRLLATTLLSAACLLAGFAHADGERDLARETLQPDNGWAASGSGVTGGSTAVDTQVYTVTNRAELIAALNNGVPSSTSPSNPSNEPKIIYVQGTIDGNVDDANQPLACTDYYRNGFTIEAISRDVRSGGMGPYSPARPCRSRARRLATGAAGARAHPHRLEHHDRRPRPRRHDPRRLARHPRHGGSREQPQQHHRAQPDVPRHVRLLPGVGADRRRSRRVELAVRRDLAARHQQRLDRSQHLRGSRYCRRDAAAALRSAVPGA